MRGRVAAVVASLVLACASAANAAEAPGLVTHAFTSGTKQQGLVGASALMPDGRLVFAASATDSRGVSRMRLIRLRRSGRLDRAFGDGGIADLRVRSASPPTGIQSLVGGRLLVTSPAHSVPKDEFARVVLTMVLPNGRIDRSFGVGGSLITPIQGSSASVLPEGKILVTGATGKFGPPDARYMPTTGSRMSATLRLNADGSTDTSFGTGGIVSLNPAFIAFGAVSGPGGRIVLLGERLLALRGDGTIDPGFNGGHGLRLAGRPAGLSFLPDGSMIVLTRDGSAPGSTIQRVLPDGSIDLTYGSGGSARISYGGSETSFGVRPDGSVVLVTTRYGDEGHLGRPVRLTRLLPDGTTDPSWGGELAPRFGGDIGIGRWESPTGKLGRNTFSMSAVHVRPDGGVLVTGSVVAKVYTGEDSGPEHREIAVAAYRPDLSADRSWGGRSEPAALSIRMPPQRARTVALRPPRAIRIVASTNGTGMADVQVRVRNRLVARSFAIVHRAGPGQVLRAYIAPAERAALARARSVPVTVTATFRDLLAREARAGARGRLR